ncbi:MAG: tryptophan--tRNA ligase [Parcubacteria group bacterium CG2_30_44_11]|nr:MAG: tryptophan--tRNA ligase [Parcubacteria group bacterium CG2_30_44_11]
MKKRMLTGIQASGDLHIGNYFGALKPFVDFLAENSDYESFLMVADYHALTSLKDGAALRQNTYNVVKDYLAAGVDPEKVVIFRQSDNQDHMELAWVLNCMVTVPFLMQGHAYKDKVAKGLDANAGLFTYPVLMAADIALYDTDVVPVGEDQRQHLEYTREAVTKFNNIFGELLKEPKEHIMKAVGTVLGLDGQKMSKSYKNTIPLFGTPEEVEKAVMKIVTDSNGSFPQNVFAIHCLVKPEAELRPVYEASAGHYGDLKKQLAADLNEYLAPMRERRATVTDAQVQQVLANGVARAKIISNATIKRVRDAIGMTL